MASSVIQAAPKGRTAGADTVSCSFGSLPVAGRAVIVMVFGYQSSGDPDFGTGAVTDNQSNTYVRAVQSAKQFGGTDGLRTAIFYCENIGTPSGTYTITANGANSNDGLTIGAIEVAGLLTASSLDKTASSLAAATTTPVSGTTATTAQADEFMVSVYAYYGGGVITITEDTGSGWTERVTETDSNTYTAGEGDSRTATSVGTYSHTWTTSNGSYTACIATFKDDPAFALSYDDEVLADNPVLYWRLDETVGTGTVQDSTASNNDGTVSGATLGAASLTAGDAGTSATFDGTNDAISTTTIPTTAVDNWTMEAWIKTPASLPTPSEAKLFMMNGTDGTNGYGFGVGTAAGAAGSTLVAILGGVTWVGSGTTLVVSTIYHVVLRRLSGTTTFYINGVQQSGSTASAPNAPTGKFAVGGEFGGASITRDWTGGVARAAVYNTALSSLRIATHYAVGSNTPLVLRAYYTVAGTAAFTATNGATVTPGLPVGWEPNDIFILHAHRSDNTAMTALTGWTQVASLSGNNTAAQRQEIWWRRAVAGDAAPVVTFGTGTIVRGARIYGVRGAPPTGDPFDTGTGTPTRDPNAASATIGFIDLTTTAPNCLVLALGAYEDDPTTTTTVSGYSQAGAGVSGSTLGNDMMLSAQWKEFPVAGAAGVTAITVSGGTFANSVNVGVLISILPDPGVADGLFSGALMIATASSPVAVIKGGAAVPSVAVMTATALSPVAVVRGAASVPAAIMLATALSPVAVVRGGTALPVAVMLATALSPVAVVRGGAVLGGAAMLATALAPVASFTTGASVGSAAMLATALMPVASVTSRGLVPGAVMVATALMPVAVVVGGLVFNAAAMLATALSPVAALSATVSGSFAGAAMLATALMPDAVVRGGLVFTSVTMLASAVMPVAVFATGASVPAAVMLSTALMPVASVTSRGEVLAAVMLATASSGVAVVIGGLVVDAGVMTATALMPVADVSADVAATMTAHVMMASAILGTAVVRGGLVVLAAAMTATAAGGAATVVGGAVLAAATALASATMPVASLSGAISDAFVSVAMLASADAPDAIIVGGATFVAIAMSSAAASAAAVFVTGAKVDAAAMLATALSPVATITGVIGGFGLVSGAVMTATAAMPVALVVGGLVVVATAMTAIASSPPGVVRGGAVMLATAALSAVASSPVAVVRGGASVAALVMLASGAAPTATVTAQVGTIVMAFVMTADAMMFDAIVTGGVTPGANSPFFFQHYVIGRRG